MTQTQQRQQHSTTAPPAPHPHGEDYRRAVYLANAAEAVRHIRNDILHNGYRLGQGDALGPEDILLLNQAAQALHKVSDNLNMKAEHFSRIAYNPSPEAVSTAPSS